MSHTYFRLWAVIFWAFIITLVCGCTSVAPYRYTLTPKPDGHFYPISKCLKDANHADDYLPDYNPKHFKNEPPSEMPSCYSASVERVDVADSKEKGIGTKYTLFFIEFDEQGRFYDRRQFTALTEYLMQFKKNAKLIPKDKNCTTTEEFNTGVSIVTFVHGWRNNSRHDNGNVHLARKILDFTYKGERAGTQYNPLHCPREVVGVYVGWRGLSTATSDLPEGLTLLGSPWEAISVWERKNTAQNVAVGSVRELFSTLKIFQDDRNSDESIAKTPCIEGSEKEREIYLCKPVRHLIVGHSYGALIVNNAVSQQLLESITRGTFADPITECTNKETGKPGNAIVGSYADLIILLNPAVEGARYEPLQDASAARARKEWGTRGAYCPEQKPVLIVLTSEQDWATRWAFWLVRGTTTVFESNAPQNDAYRGGEREYLAREEAVSSINTLGQNPRYHTHVLTGWDRFIQTPDKSVTDIKQPDRVDLAAAVALKNYARSFTDACDNRPEDPLESKLTALRCMDKVAAAKELNRKDKNLCDAWLTEILLSRALLGRRTALLPNEEKLDPYWTATFAGGSTLRQLRDYAPSRLKALQAAELDTQHSPASPLWNIYVQDSSIMKGHSDIDSPRLLLLLQQLYHAVVISSFEPEVLRKFGDEAEAKYREKSCNK